MVSSVLQIKETRHEGTAPPVCRTRSGAAGLAGLSPRQIVFSYLVFCSSAFFGVCINFVLKKYIALKCYLGYPGFGAH